MGDIAVAGEGGTIGNIAQDYARIEILSEFASEPKGTQKSLSEIFSQRHITDPTLRELCLQEAEGMVARRYLRFDEEGVWVFAEKSPGQYSWERAGLTDRVINYAHKLNSQYHLRQ